MTWSFSTEEALASNKPTAPTTAIGAETARMGPLAATGPAVGFMRLNLRVSGVDVFKEFGCERANAANLLFSEGFPGSRTTGGIPERNMIWKVVEGRGNMEN